MMFRPISVFIGSRYTRAKRRNHFISFISLTSLIGLALGVLAMIMVLSVMNGFQREMSARILGMVPHATVIGEQPLDDWQAVAARLSAHPQIVGMAPVTQLEGMLSFKGSMQPIQISGIDPQAEAQVSIVGERLVGGSLDALKPGEYGVIIGLMTARRFGLKLGDKLTLIVPEVSSSPGGVTPRMQRLNVVGVFKVGADLDGSLGMIHRADAAQIHRWMPQQVQGVRLKLDDLYRAPDVAAQVQATLGEGYRVEDWSYTQGSLFSAMKMEKTMIGLLLLLIVAVAAFNIVSTLVMVVTDKKSDIAILRTLGATPRQIMAVFMVQGTFIGVIGTAIGCLLGVLAALNVSAALAWVQRVTGHQFLNAEVYFIDYLPAQLQLHDVLLVCGASFALSFLATLYPSWSAARTQPAEALRYE